MESQARTCVSFIKEGIEDLPAHNPVGLLLASSALAKHGNGKTVLDNFNRFGYAIIPLDMAGHIAHNLFHLLAEGKAIGFTALALVGKEVHEDSTAFVDSATIQVPQYALVGLGTIASVYTAYRLTRSRVQGATRKGGGSTTASDQSSAISRKPGVTFTAYAVLMLLLAVANLYLFSLPMGMRM
jgi:hypothetical protein